MIYFNSDGTTQTNRSGGIQGGDFQWYGHLLQCCL